MPITVNRAVRFGTVEAVETYRATCPHGRTARWTAVLVNVIDDELGGTDMARRTLVDVDCSRCTP